MGKVGIPDSVLLKPGTLAPEEFEIMQKHSVYGRRTFEPMSADEWQTFKSHTFMGEMIMDVQSSPIITMAAKIALTHHEKWDGTGYPIGLKGKEIPLAGRITAVAASSMPSAANALQTGGSSWTAVSTSWRKAAAHISIQRRSMRSWLLARPLLKSPQELADDE